MLDTAHSEQVYQIIWNYDIEHEELPIYDQIAHALSRSCNNNRVGQRPIVKNVSEVLSELMSCRILYEESAVGTGISEN